MYAYVNSVGLLPTKTQNLAPEKENRGNREMTLSVVTNTMAWYQRTQTFSQGQRALVPLQYALSIDVDTVDENSDVSVPPVENKIT
jgi:hypothetical protein